MITFLIRRLIFLVFVLFGVTILVFGILMTFSPERRAAAYITSPQQAKDIPKIVAKYGLNDPFYLQYFRWLKEIARGNLGWSLVASSTVMEAFLRYLPVTLELVIFSAPLIVITGIWFGTLAGVHRDSWIDHSSRIISIIGWSLPTFLFGLILLMLFYGYFNWFPPGISSNEVNMYVLDHADTFTRYTGMYSIDGLLNGEFWIVWDALKHLVLPVITQVIVIFALLVRVMRSGMIEALTQDYVITARAKGADKNTVNKKHARRNALIPVMTISGLLTAQLVTGSISVEVVFNRQGMGWWLANSAIQLDVPALLSVCLFVGFIFVIANLIVDIMYAYIDPRIRLS
ncbi:binding-protein-dependent transport systems inner membrane component [Candidatus Vecturithrix granuli]|uniref:Binding-protein-dependent transport systems inner membrane component n=1 Tax=Vecturithrix granuli TaxID=1499967 RepID=A0A0S6W9X5_VECG1|nr:binding-protein-dependent transport systems inner membrane component [Candidatus Vecturithrix granuli]